MSTGYKILEQGELHYLTLQIVGWVDLFTRQIYKDIIIENLKYCQENKGLVIYGYVIMSNHIHLLVHAENNNLSNVIRDFKSYTSKVFLKTIEHYSKESRKEWLLNYFEHSAKKHKRNSKYQIWTHENHAEYIYSERFINQKIDYIHNNPVEAGIVFNAEDYIYSSARNYARLDYILKVEFLDKKWKTVN